MIAEYNVLVFAGASIVALGAAYWGVHKCRVLQRSLEAQLSRFEHRLQTATSGSIGMGQRIITLEGRLKVLLDAKELSPNSDSVSYTQAMQLFDCGADVDTVIANCDISSSEASLMALIREHAHNSLHHSVSANKATVPEA